MKNKSLIALAMVVSIIERENYEELSNLQERINSSSGINKMLEFKLGFNKWLNEEILRLKYALIISEEEARLASSATHHLFDGRCGWWYENNFLINYYGDTDIPNMMKYFYQNLIFEAVCSSEDGAKIFEIPERSRLCLTMFCGLCSEPSKSIEDISDELNLSFERVRQEKEKAKRLILNWFGAEIGCKLKAL